jgi:hypothetical protein
MHEASLGAAIRTSLQQGDPRPANRSPQQVYGRAAPIPRSVACGWLNHPSGVMTSRVEAATVLLSDVEED